MILGPDGSPISSVSEYKKATPPKLGEKFAPYWTGDHDRRVFQLPGGAAVLFDLSRLTLADFRAMRDHYQVNATLAVLTFMMHQMDWRIECSNQKIRVAIEENIKEVWIQIIRGISQAFWAGYSPNVLQWENDIDGRKVLLGKVKDLVPEMCAVNWKDVEGWAPPSHAVKPKIKVYDGIKVWGQGWPIPVDNTLWYPLMMENGDYYGRKLLRPVFTSWYFSILIHLFSNRYFERFGEPVPIGRAPYEDEITVGNTKVNGAVLMENVLQSLRNRSVVVLPNERTPIGNGNASEYDYDIQYLESQMRGADFERYLMRLDEEISIGLFTPLLILRTADVGSYNLGSTHWSMYMNMLNAIAGDVKQYIDAYILNRWVDYNAGPKAPRAKIVFRKLGTDKMQMIQAMMQSLIASGKVKPDLEEIGDIAGLTFTEVKELTDDPGTEPPDDAKQDPEGESGQSRQTANARGGAKKSANPPATSKKNRANASAVIQQIAGRVSAQANKFVREGTPGSFFAADLGYRRQLEEALLADGVQNAPSVGERILSIGSAWAAELSYDYLASAGAFMIAEIAEKSLLALLEEAA